MFHVALFDLTVSIIKLSLSKLPRLYLQTLPSDCFHQFRILLQGSHSLSFLCFLLHAFIFFFFFFTRLQKNMSQLAKTLIKIFPNVLYFHSYFLRTCWVSSANNVANVIIRWPNYIFSQSTFCKQTSSPVSYGYFQLLISPSLVTFPITTNIDLLSPGSFGSTVFLL